MFENYADIVSIEEMCEMLDIGKNAAYILINSGNIKGFRMNRVWKIPKQSIIDYINKSCEEFMENKKKLRPIVKVRKGEA